MIDGCGRQIDHLRLSLTDHCNLACRYCAPTGGRPDGQMISAEFAFRVVRWLSRDHGIRHVRLTGGEPLLFPELVPLIERLSELDALHEISLTTNGQALARKARSLRAAGLARVNISLDTLRVERFTDLTGGGNLAHTLRGIEAAVDADLTPVKVNVVAQRGLNDDDLADIAEWCLSRGCVVRFLEVMPIGPCSHILSRHLVPGSEILRQLRERFELRPIPQSLGQPATDYAATRGRLRGVIGVIAATTRPFCSSCRRLRVTSRGAVVACLQDDRHFNLAECWSGRALDIKRANTLLDEAVGSKPAVGPRNQSRTMLSLGG